MKLISVLGLTHSMHFWMTWFPFWSRTQRITIPSSSAVNERWSATGSTCTAKWGLLERTIQQGSMDQQLMAAQWGQSASAGTCTHRRALLEHLT